MQNYVQPGDAIAAVFPYAVNAGGGVLFGGRSSASPWTPWPPAPPASR
jgi:predicted RecA/RadA family phage recombinase